MEVSAWFGVVELVLGVWLSISLQVEGAFTLASHKAGKPKVKCFTIA